MDRKMKTRGRLYSHFTYFRLFPLSSPIKMQTAHTDSPITMTNFSAALAHATKKIQDSRNAGNLLLKSVQPNSPVSSYGKHEYNVGIDTLPAQVESMKAKNGAKFNLLLVGGAGCGKTTFINTLFGTTVMPNIWSEIDSMQPNTEFKPGREILTHRVNLVEDGFTLDLTLIETKGFNDFINNMFAYIPITEYIDEHLRRYMFQEEQPDRSMKVDNRVHVCLFFINPSSRGLSPAEIESMKHISSRVNLIPVISKADTLTKSEIESTKDLVKRIIKAQGIKICEFIDDEEVKQSIVKLSPFSLIGSETFVTIEETQETVRGRKYKWGVAEVMNPLHCDFVKLRGILMSENMADLISSTEAYYEKCRSRLIETRLKKSKELIDNYHKETDELAENGTRSEVTPALPEKSIHLAKVLHELRLNYDDLESFSGIQTAMSLCIFDKDHVDLQVSDWSPEYVHKQLQTRKRWKEIAKTEELHQREWKQSLANKQERFNAEQNLLNDILTGLKLDIKALGGDRKSKHRRKKSVTKEEPTDGNIIDESLQADADQATEIPLLNSNTQLEKLDHKETDAEHSINWSRPTTSCGTETDPLHGRRGEVIGLQNLFNSVA